MTIQTELSRKQPRAEAPICHPISILELLVPCTSEAQPLPGFGLKCQSTLYPYDEILDTLTFAKRLALVHEGACQSCLYPKLGSKEKATVAFEGSI